MKGFFIFAFYNRSEELEERRESMNTENRRKEIINVLLMQSNTTAKELAKEFGVTIRTIQNDIQALSSGFPIYTKPGGGGGIFIGENYRPYNNTLSSYELEILLEMHETTEGIYKKVLFRIISRYGPEKLEVEL